MTSNDSIAVLETHIHPDAFVCDASERRCALPQLAPGRCSGRVQVRTMIGHRANWTERRIILDDGRVLPLFGEDSLRHLKAFACEMQAEDGRHEIAPCPAGPVSCSGSHHGYRDAGPTVVVVGDA